MILEWWEGGEVGGDEGGRWAVKGERRREDRRWGERRDGIRYMYMTESNHVVPNTECVTLYSCFRLAGHHQQCI